MTREVIPLDAEQFEVMTEGKILELRRQRNRDAPFYEPDIPGDRAPPTFKGRKIATIEEPAGKNDNSKAVGGFTRNITSEGKLP